MLATARDFLLRNSADRSGSVWFCNPEVMAKVLRNEVTAEVKHRFFHPISLRLRKGLVAFGPTAN